MSRGDKDYGVKGYTLALNDSPNDGVITSLLGFSPLDMRGRQLIIDNFTRGLSTWYIGAGGGGELPKMDATNMRSYAPGAGVTVNPQLSGAYSYLRRDMFFVWDGSVSVETAYYITGFSSNPQIYIKYYTTPTKYNQYAIRYFSSGGKFQIYSNNTWYDIGVGGFNSSYVMGWVQIKLTVNLSNKAYESVMLPGTIKDLTYMSVEDKTGAGNNVLTVEVGSACTDGTYKQPVYLGYCVVSYDEPK